MHRKNAAAAAAAAALLLISYSTELRGTVSRAGNELLLKFTVSRKGPNLVSKDHYSHFSVMIFSDKHPNIRSSYHVLKPVVHIRL